MCLQCRENLPFTSFTSDLKKFVIIVDMFGWGPLRQGTYILTSLNFKYSVVGHFTVWRVRIQTIFESTGCSTKAILHESRKIFDKNPFMLLGYSFESWDLLAMSTWYSGLSYDYWTNALIKTLIRQEEMRLTSMEIPLWWLQRLWENSSRASSFLFLHQEGVTKAGLSTLPDNLGDSTFWSVSPGLQIRVWNLPDNRWSLPFLQ